MIRNLDGSQKTDGQADAAILRICRRAGLRKRGSIGCGTASAPTPRCSA